ncbi:MAG: Hsp20/alpha crystallin family protein [Candidatus Andersenbacteria bacterium]
MKETTIQATRPLFMTTSSRCRRRTIHTEENKKVNLQEDDASLSLEIDTQGVDPGRLYVWVKRRHILVLGHTRKESQGNHHQSFIRTIKLNHPVDGHRAIVEKLHDTLHILVPKAAM